MRTKFSFVILTCQLKLLVNVMLNFVRCGACVFQLTAGISVCCGQEVWFWVHHQDCAACYLWYAASCSPAGERPLEQHVSSSVPVKLMGNQDVFFLKISGVKENKSCAVVHSVWKAKTTSLPRNCQFMVSIVWTRLLTSREECFFIGNLARLQYCTNVHTFSLCSFDGLINSLFPS